jgi:NAD(P)-dependent dehydrogenase (short-subunit alcohol dehydrogenase family)
MQRQPSARVHVIQCDVSDPDSIEGAVAKVRAAAPRLHALVHNAGVMPAKRTEAGTGHELTFATHVLGPHLLTALLQPQLIDDGDGRVVFVSSGGMYTQPLRIDDLQYEHEPYEPTTAYARTKRMQVVLAEQWADHLRDVGVSVHSMHPGWADTPGVLDSLPRFAKLTGPILRTPEQGADTAVWLLGSKDAGTSTGLFWHDRRPRPTTYLGRHAGDEGDARELWEVCVEVTGLP